LIEQRWTVTRFGDVLHVKHGFAFKSQFFGDRGDYIVLTPGNFRDEGGFKPKSGAEKFYAAQPPQEFVLAEGDLIVAMTEQTEGLIGSSALVPAGGRYLHNQRIGLVQITAPHLADKRFLYYLFNTGPIRTQLEATATGAKVRHTAPARIEALKTAVPPLSEQRRIASILSAYDDLIENNTRRIQILEEMAQAIYREWFLEFRFPGHEGVRMVDSELGPIPEGWCVASLGEVCRRVTDGAHKSPPSTAEGYPMASVKDMTPRSLDIDRCRRISASDFADLVRQDCKPRKGDVLIAKDGSYLKEVFAVEEEQDVVILSSIALLRPGDTIDPWVLAMYLRQSESRERLAGYVSGVAIPRIVLKDFKAFPIMVPAAGLQRVFKSVAVPPLLLALNLEKSIARLRQVRDLLLPRLISGEIDVSKLGKADTEPAA
jgi:type I restriction enzyme S subunit